MGHFMKKCLVWKLSKRVNTFTSCQCFGFHLQIFFWVDVGDIKRDVAELCGIIDTSFDRLLVDVVSEAQPKSN